MAFGAAVGSTAFFITHGFKQNAEPAERHLLQKGSMYSILFLGKIMVLDSFGFDIPSWLTLIITFLIIGYFFIKSKNKQKKNNVGFEKNYIYLVLTTIPHKKKMNYSAPAG